MSGLYSIEKHMLLLRNITSLSNLVKLEKYLTIMCTYISTQMLPSKFTYQIHKHMQISLFNHTVEFWTVFKHLNNSGYALLW